MPCSENDAVNDVNKAVITWWFTFWSQEDAFETMMSNYYANQEAVDNTVGKMQYYWREQEFDAAGEAYGDMWVYLLGYPDFEFDEFILQ